MKTVSSSFSSALGMYYNCVEEDGFVVEAHLTPEPMGRVTAHGTAALVIAWLEGHSGNLSAVRLGPKGTDFQKRVWNEIRKIPPGQVRTYGEVAGMVGSPGAARAVGSAMKSNPVVILVPCHRVVSADGLGGYSAHGGLRTKVKLLELERRVSVPKERRLHEVTAEP